jgi:hypothetical protein
VWGGALVGGVTGERGVDGGRGGSGGCAVVRPVRMTSGVVTRVLLYCGDGDQYRRDWVLVVAGLVGNAGGYLLYAPLRSWSRSALVIINTTHYTGRRTAGRMRRRRMLMMTLVMMISLRWWSRCDDDPHDPSASHEAPGCG